MYFYNIKLDFLSFFKQQLVSWYGNDSPQYNSTQYGLWYKWVLTPLLQLHVHVIVCFAGKCCIKFSFCPPLIRMQK